MQTVYKSCSPKYTHQDIADMGTCTKSFVSFERLLKTSIYEAIALRSNEKIVGMQIDMDGIYCYIETKE